MQYDIDGGNITVIVGEEVRIDVPTALNYIKSGQAEIGAAVDAGIEAFDLNAANKTTAYDNNASAKLAAYNDNATDKLNAFDLNASGKTTDFNDNYTLKKAAVDASADAAAASATLAQQWAIKMDGKVADEDYSAKYYADLASQAAGATGANIDLSNLSPTGEAKFEAKQDVIDADHKLSYNYLSDTPDLSAYVTTNTAQTITGTKTFTQDVVMQKSVTKGTVPENSVYYDIKFVDSNNAVMGIVETRVGDNGDVYTALGACKNESGSSAAEVITVHYPANGNPYTSAPTPTDTTTTSGTQIATTGWVNTAGDSANNIVHKTGTETITGEKTLQNHMLIFKTTATAYNETPTTNQYAGYSWKDKNGAEISAFYSALYASGLGIDGGLTGFNLKNKSGDTAIICLRYDSYGTFFANSPEIRPNTDNTQNLGVASLRWKQLYAGTTTIATSDERVKQGIENVPDAVLDAWGDVEFYRYKFNDAVAEKGFENARYHTGMVAQRIRDTFTAHGLDATKYGLLCYDEWKAQPAEVDEHGKIIRPAQEAGNRYSLRYEECLCMEAAYQRRRAERIEARLAALEARL